MDPSQSTPISNPLLDFHIPNSERPNTEQGWANYFISEMALGMTPYANRLKIQLEMQDLDLDSFYSIHVSIIFNLQVCLYKFCFQFECNYSTIHYIFIICNHTSRSTFVNNLYR